MIVILLLLNCFSRVRLCTTLWTAAHQAPLSMGFSRQEHWSGLPFPSPKDLPNPGIEPMSPTSLASPALKADSLPLSHQGSLSWLGLSASTAVAWVQSLVREIRSYKPCSTDQKQTTNKKLQNRWQVRFGLWAILGQTLV